MAMLLWCILLLFFHHRQITISEAHPLEIVNTTLDFIASLRDDRQKVVDLYLKPVTFEQRYTSESDRAVFHQLRDLSSDEVSRLKINFQAVLDPFDDGYVKKLLTDLYENLDTLENKFAKFIGFRRGYTSDDLEELRFEALNVVIYTDYYNVRLAEHLANELPYFERRLVCEHRRSLQQILVGYYVTLLKANLASLGVYSFARDALSGTVDFSNFQVDPIGDAVKSIQASYPILEANLNKLSSAPIARKLYRCDPPKHVEHLTYTNLQPIFQRFIQYEADVKRDDHAPYSPLNYRYQACRTPHCAQYNDAGKHYVECREKSGSNYCDLQATSKRCTGYFRDCEALNPDDYAASKVCLGRAGSERRVNWLVDSNNERHGPPSDSCHNGVAYVLRSIVYEAFLNGDRYCAFCACTCVLDDEEDLDRYFSVEPVMADRLANRVVTALRLVKVGRVFHAQVAHGVLAAKGAVSSSEWKRLETRYDDSYATIHTGYQQSPRDPYSFTKLTKYHSSPYVYPITYDQRTVHLDDVVPDEEGVVVTGLRLTPVRDALKLQVHATPFDYESGRLLGQGRWYPELRDDADERTEVTMLNAAVPTERYHHPVHSGSKQYVKFRLSGVKQDFGQTIVPFLDTQAVESDRPVPLAGIGLMHKGGHESGGFLAFSLTEYNFGARR